MQRPLSLLDELLRPSPQDHGTRLSLRATCKDVVPIHQEDHEVGGRDDAEDGFTVVDQLSTSLLAESQCSL